MNRVLAALRAELVVLQLPLHELLILTGVVVATLAGTTAELYLVFIAL